MNPQDNTTVRIDKWLWAVRIFKTRNQAAAACDRKKIWIGDIAVKPSRIVKLNDIIFYKQTGITRQYLVKELLINRVSAKLAVDFVKEITPEEDIIKFKAITEDAFYTRDRGTGRPTKKERRLLNDVIE